MSDYFPFRVYIGPRPVAKNDPNDWGKWDWVGDIGSEETTTLPYVGLHALTVPITGLSTTDLPIDSADIPLHGGLWIGPTAAMPTQRWEYIAYRNSGDSYIRNIPGGSDGVHSAGSSVYFWYPLDSNDGTLTYTEELSDNTAVITWTAKLSGVRAPVDVLKPEHIIAVVSKALDGVPPAPGEDYRYLKFFVGTIERVTMSTSADRIGTWEIDIVSTARLMQQTSVPGVRLGPLNIALQATANASSSLGAAWKETLPQRESSAATGLPPEIDLVEFQEDLGPQHIVDDNPNTLWISDGWRGPDSVNAYSHPGWNALFSYPPPTDVFGVRYIEIIAHAGLASAWYYVFTKYSYLDEFSVPQIYRSWRRAVEYNFFADEGLTGDSLDHADATLVIAEDGDEFNRLFPSAQPTVLLDAQTFDGPDLHAVRRLWWEGGAIFFGSAGGGEQLIMWGDVSYTEIQAEWELGYIGESFDLPSQTWHVGIADMKPGEVVHKDRSVAGANWVSDYFHHPGYKVTDDNDDLEWLQFVIPNMMHLLRDDVEPGAAGFFVVDAQGNPNVEGISKHGEGGVVVIDDEFIPFGFKDYYTGALTGATVTARHKAGSKVYVRWKTTWTGEPNIFGTKVFDLATDAYPLEKIEWGRGVYASTGGARIPYIGRFKIRPSIKANARTPDQERHLDDYITSFVIDSTTWTPAIDLANSVVDTTVPFFGAEGFRPRSLLMDIFEMRNQSAVNTLARPRLNYFRAFVDKRYFNPDTWLTEDNAPLGVWTNELVIERICTLSTLYDSMFTIFMSGTPPIIIRQSSTTEPDTMWRVATDMAEYGNSIIVALRSGQVEIRNNNFLVDDSHPVGRVFNTDDIAELEIVNVRPASVGQVRLTWINGDKTDGGVVLYPESLPRGTTLVEIGPLLAFDEASAQKMAFNHYSSKRFPYNIFVALARADLLVRAGEVHHVVYDWSRKGDVQIRLCLVESVTHQVENGIIRTVVGYREIERLSV